MLTGHCLCGGVRFEIDGELGPASYCHCSRCQRRTGAAASANAQIPAGALRLLQGEELVRAWSPPDGWANSSAQPAARRCSRARPTTRSA